jgi:TM2 domain-containing membrane protein YozV
MSTDQPQPVNGLKLAAGLLGIFLGGLGAHKMALGYWKAAFIMLGLTVLSCGILYIPIHIVGIVEAVIYLTRTDDDFRTIYVIGTKEWF